MSEISFELTQLATEGSAIDRLARSLLAEGADDVTQEAFLAYLRRPEAVRETLGQFLSGTVKRLVHNRFRAEHRRTSREKSAARRESVEPSSAWVEKIERRKLVADAVLGLPPSDREIVILRYFEDLPPREIARRLDLGNDVVRSRLSRALARLREHLDHTHGDDRTAWTSLLLPLAANGLRPSGLREILAVKVKMKVVLPLVLISFVVAGVIGFFRSEADSTTIPQESVDAVAAPDASPRRETAAVPQPKVADAAPVVAPKDDRDTPQEAPLLGQSLEVIVVDAATDRPIADAEVILLNRFDAIVDPKVSYRRILASELTRISASEAAKKFGSRFKTDRSGRVVIPRVPPMSEISAFAERKFGRVDLFGDIPPSATIRVVGERTLIVKVVDADNRPVAEMPVVAGPSLGHFSMSGRPTFEPTVRGKTDASGIARLTVSGLNDGAVSIAAALDIAGGESTIATEPVADWPDDGITLKKPDTTEVEITVVGTDGRPVEDGAVVRLDEHRMVGPMKEFTTSNTWSVTKSGKALFPFAQSGIEIGVSVVLPHGIPEDFTFKTPSRGGETARFEAKLTGRMIEVTGHVAFTNGDDVVNMLLFVQAIDGPGQSAVMRPMLTDALGMVKFSILDHGRPTTFVVLAQAPGSGPPRQFTVAAKDGERSVHIGDILIPPAPFIVAGRVVDTDHEPVKNAEINVQVDHRFGDRTRRPARTDADGRFKFEGVLPPDTEIAVVATADGFVQDRPFAAKFGADDVHIVMQPAIALKGKLLVDPQVDATQIGVTLRKAGAHRLSAEGHAATPRSDGQFSIPGIPEGSYDVFIDDGIELREELVLSNVAIATRATDERLASIDLRGRFEVAAIVAEDPAGRPVEASVTGHKNGDGPASLKVRGGRVIFPKTSRFAHLAASYGDVDPIILPATSGKFVVRFTAMRTIELRTKAPWNSTDADRSLLVEITPITEIVEKPTGKNFAPYRDARPVVESPTAEPRAITISAAERYRVAYSIRVEGGATPRIIPVETPALTVALDSGGESITLDLPMAAIDAAVAKSKK